MSKYFTNPLPVAALEEFCHPVNESLGQPFRHDGEVWAANGYAVIRCFRGYWDERDFRQAPAEALSRLERINWAAWERMATDLEKWTPLHPYLGDIFRGCGKQRRALWMDGKSRLQPGPVWNVNTIPVRLTLLQLVAAMPRAEIYTGPTTNPEPLWFRFNGGRGALARDSRLKTWSKQFLCPRYCPLTGAQIKHPK